LPSGWNEEETPVNVTELRCIKCGRRYHPDRGNLVCDDCGRQGLLEVEYDYRNIARNYDRDALAAVGDRTMWRYAAFLPVTPGDRRSGLLVGGTPLYRAQRLGQAVGLTDLWVKDEGLNPTGSLKDRASALAVARALESGYNTVACASTGNAASSLAGNAANRGLRSVIFVPSRAPAGKVAQLLIYGATVISVDGTYEQTFALSETAIEERGWYNRNAAINPYLVEGKKTVALELAEQFGWKAPDWVALSVGDGCTLAGVYKGFYDLVQVGWVDRIPRLLGVQAEGCAPIYRALATGRLEPAPENTLADSIAVGKPRNPDKAIQAVKNSQGSMVTVSDEDILDAMRLLGRTTGIFGEPAGVAGLAGLRKAVASGLVGSGELAVVIMTGNGLKDIASGTRAATPPVRIPPDPEALEGVLGAAGLG
jgi:threonine synthase